MQIKSLWILFQQIGNPILQEVINQKIFYQLVNEIIALGCSVTYGYAAVRDFLNKVEQHNTNKYLNMRDNLIKLILYFNCSRSKITHRII